MKKAASIFLQPEIRMRDMDNLLRWLKNETVTQYMNESNTVSDEIRSVMKNVPDYLWRCQLNRHGCFFLICDDTARSIGFVRCVPLSGSVYEIVFAIGEASLWGNGYGAAAVSKAVAHLFLELRATQVVAKIYHGNTRSKHTVRHCGFMEAECGEKLSVFSLTLEQYLKKMHDSDASCEDDRIVAYG